MKKFIKKISYKILVVSMITILLSFFSVSSVVQAKITLEDGEFYYTGTQEAEITWEASFGQKLIKALFQIGNFIIGSILLVLRAVVIGWIEIAEILLTALLGVEPNWQEYFAKSLSGTDEYTQNIVNIEKIIFNEVEILDIDIFSSISNKEDSEAQAEIENNSNLDNLPVYVTDEPEKNDEPNNPNDDKKEQKPQVKILNIIKETVAKWYIILRLIAIAIMLIILLFIGIKAAISAAVSDKIVFKQMFFDWVVGMAIIFMIHYIMILMIHVNNNVVDTIRKSVIEIEADEPYQYGSLERRNTRKNPSELETRLYESARTRAYSTSPLDGTTGTIIYGVLVYYAWKFALIYLKRLLNIMILTIISPVIAATYAFNKAMSGKATIFTTWLKEYFMNVVIQVFHIIIYITFVSTALELSLGSIIGAVFATILIGFMSKSGQLLRQLFNITGGTGSLFEDMASKTNFRKLRSKVRNIKNLAMGGKIGQKAIKITRRAASKPIRMAAEGAFGIAMKYKIKSPKYKKRKEKKEGEIKDSYNEFINSEPVIKKRKELEDNEEKLYAKSEKIKQEKEEIEKKLELAQNDSTKDEAKIEDLSKQLQEKEEEEKQNNFEIEKNKKEIDDFEEGLQHEFLDYYVRSQTTWEAIRDNFETLFDPEQYLDKEEISFSQIEEKASEMFEDFDKYKKFISAYTIVGSRKKLLTQQAILNKSKIKLNMKKANLEKELTEAKTKKDDEKTAELQSKIEKIEKQIKENEAAIEQNKQDLEKVEAKAKEKSIDLSNTEPYEDEEELEEAYKNVQEMRNSASEELTTYKLKPTKREGGANLAFWRKKESGIGKIFWDNAKFDKLLGISGDEKKVLKDEFNTAKSVITGVASGIAGFSMLGVSPPAGIFLLSQHINTRTSTFIKMRQIKNSPSRLKYDYKFKAFGEGTVKTITEELEREIKFKESQMTKQNAKFHPGLANRLLHGADAIVRPIVIGTTTVSGLLVGASLGEGIHGERVAEKEQPFSDIPKTHYKRKEIGIATFADEKLNDIYQKKARKAVKSARKELIELNTKSAEEEYKEEVKKYRKEIIKEVDEKTDEELIQEEIFSSENVAKIGDTIIELKDPAEIEIKLDEELYELRVDEVTSKLKSKKSKLLEVAILDLAIAKKVTDVDSLELDELGRLSVKKQIKERYERKCHLKKGDIKIDKIIKDSDIDEALRKIKQSRKQSNETMAERIVQKACFGYMTQNNITDSKMLKNEDVKKKIQEIIGTSLMSKTSKKSAQVISNINGGQPKESELPETLFGGDVTFDQRIDNATKKIKKSSVSRRADRIKNKLSREQLTQRSIIRRENQMKSNLEFAMYTGDETQVADDAQLKMLFLLSEIGRQNRKSYKVEGKKAKKTKERTLAEMRYEQARQEPDIYAEYDEQNQEPLRPREEDLDILLHGRKDIIDIINS